MKIVRKIAKNKLVAVTLSGMLLFTTSCTKESLNPTGGASSTTNSSNKYENYSGEKIFKGLFFFQNELTEEIPQLKEIKSEMSNMMQNQSSALTTDKKSTSENEIVPSKSELTSSINDLSDVTITYINDKYPDFFTEFESIMKSGNLYEIERVMTLSSKMIDQALLTSDKYQMASQLSKELNQNPELKNEITALDLTKEKDVKKLKSLLVSVEGLEKINDKAIAFAAVLAVAYIAAAVVSFVVAAYSVVTKVAYWDPTEAVGVVGSVNQEQTIAAIGETLYVQP